MREGVFLEKRLHLPPGNGEHRPDYISIHWGNAPQPLQSGSPHQVLQYRFRVVIGSVGRGDFPGQPPEKRVPRLPGGGLQPLFPGHNLPGAQAQGDAIAIAELFHEGLVAVGLLPPEAMVEMSRFQGDAQPLPEQIQGKKQRHRVRPAGYGTDHPVAGGNQGISPDKFR